MVHGEDGSQNWGSSGHPRTHERDWVAAVGAGSGWIRSVERTGDELRGLRPRGGSAGPAQARRDARGCGDNRVGHGLTACG
jgi:hypothetical protein